MQNIIQNLNSLTYEYTRLYDEKLSQVQDFSMLYKTRYSNNITIEDWNILVKQASNLNSDSTVQHNYLQSLSNTLNTAFSLINNMSSKNSNFYNVSEIDAKFETKTNAEYERYQLRYYVDNNVADLNNTIDYRTSYSLAVAKEYTDVKFRTLENTLKNIMDGSDEAYNSFVEVSNYIKSDQSVTVEMLAKINKNTADIANIKLSGTGGVAYKAGDNIKIENNVISVITTDVLEEDNTKPITSAAVQATVGNIDVLLKLI